MPLEDLSHQAGPVTLEAHPRTRFELLARVHQRFPHLGAATSRLGMPNSQCANFQAPNQKTFDGAAAGHTMAKQPRREHTRVIDDEQVASAQMRWQLIEGGVLRLFRRAVEHDQTRAAACGGRILSDQILGELEVEVADVHDPKKRPRLVRPRLARMPFQRSPTLEIRWRTLSSLKSSMRAPFSTSPQVNGTETVASGFGRTE